LEQKKEYSYIEVAAGQGTYAWKDYNANGVKELNEFEVALYQDEATFIRVFTPTNEYIKAYHQMFNQVLNITPQLASKRKTRAGRWLSRFSSQTTYRIDRKTTHDVLLEVANPFAASVKDTALTSLRSSLRNTFFFNRNSSRFGIDFTYLDNRNKFLLTNGFESRSSLLKELRFRYNLSSSFMLRMEFAEGMKESEMEFFKERDYRVYHYSIHPQLEYQSGTRFRAGLRYAYSDKLNLLGQREKVNIHNLGMESKYNIPKKGSVQAKLNYITIRYNGEANTSLAYEMLEGLQAGKNFTWGLSYQRTVAKNMQMNIAYEARKPEDVKTIHMGSVQFRAFF